MMFKPVGAACNLRCRYCYYLPLGGHLSPASGVLPLATLAPLLRDYLRQAPAEVVISWQGGEPLLAGLPYFREAMALQRRWAGPGQRVSNTLQTNGTLLDHDWCRFLREERFLVGISLDGPAAVHDAYRVRADGSGSHAAAMRGLGLLAAHGVEFNGLCVIHDRNVAEPEELLDWFVATGVPWLQFLPAVEWQGEQRQHLAPFCATPEAYGRFLCRLFDHWFSNSLRSVSIRFFDSLLATLLTGQATQCPEAARCPPQITVERDGALYACDHFVGAEWRLDRGHPTTTGPGVTPTGLGQVDWSRLARFTQRKADLAEPCRSCPWLPLCNGGCPKHRLGAIGPAAGVSVLCPAYRAFFSHAYPRLAWLADCLRRGHPPAAEDFIKPDLR